MKSRRGLLNAFSKGSSLFKENVGVKKKKDVMFIALGHDMQIRRQNEFVNQTCQQSMIWPIGDCSRI